MGFVVAHRILVGSSLLAMGKAVTTSQMNFANRAKCFAFRFPARGKPVPISEVRRRKLVTKVDGTVPSQGAISEAANTFLEEKDIRGRKDGWRKTSKTEDKPNYEDFPQSPPSRP